MKYIYSGKSILRCLVALIVISSACSCKKGSSVSEDVNPATVSTVENHHIIYGKVSPLVPIVVVIGSSTAAGWGANPIDSAWVYRLKSVVANSGKKAQFINLGVPAYTTYHLMPNGYYTGGRPNPDTSKNITKALSYKPNLVLINLPTNDIANGYSDDESLKNYSIITHQLDSAKIAYVVFGTQPRNFGDGNQRMHLKAFNDKLKAAYPTQLNDYLGVLSTSSYSIKDQYSCGDGIHLNNAGHYVIVKSVLDNKIFNSIVK